jgi:hypothetical protein
MSGKATVVLVIFLMTSYTRTVDVCPPICTCTSSQSGLDINCIDKGLTQVPVEIKSITANISKLGLSSNKIKTLDADGFGSISCRDIVLSRNKDIVINDHAFRGVKGLENIVLSNCNLKTLPADLFSDMYTLKRIFLQDNPDLKSIPLGALENGNKPVNLEEIYLAGCGVSRVRINDPCALLGTKVILTDNPVHCDCNLYSLVKSDTMVFEGICATPTEFAGRSLTPSGTGQADYFGKNEAYACHLCANVQFDCKEGKVWVDGQSYKSSEYETIECSNSNSPANFGHRISFVMFLVYVVFWILLL